MRILTVSTTDRGGGAEQVAWEVFTGLEERGHESWLAVGEKHTSHPRVFEIHASPHFDYRPFADPNLQAKWEAERRERRHRGEENFVHPYSRHLTDLLPAPPDAVIAHNLHGGFFDLRSLPALTAKVPVVAVLHDYWLLTGHCAYPFECEKWRDGCGECPDLSIPPAIEYDATRGNLRLKRAIYEQSNLAVCSASKRVLADVEKSVLRKAAARISYIPNGTNLDLFRPGNQSEARDSLGLPQDVPIILMIGKNIESNRFKDFTCAEKCMEMLAAENRECVFVALGGNKSLPTREIGSVTLMTFRFSDDRKRVADFYRASDIFLHATKQEVAPVVIGEALASGLPTVASAAGNAPELLGGGGITVPAGDAAAHAEALAQLLDDRSLRRSMGEVARRHAEDSGGRATMVSAYESLLSELIEKFPQNV